MFHDFGGHESQADRHDGLRVRQQREGLRIVHAGTNEELDMIAESMDLLRGQTSALKTYGLHVEEGGSHSSERVTGGIESPSKLPLVCGWSVDGAPVTRCGVSTAPLILPMPGDMSAGRLVNDDDDALPPGVADDEEGKVGDIRV